MKPYLIPFILTLSLFTSITQSRRLLHQPLFPVTSTPPTPPPPSSVNPFFHEHTPVQPPSPPPPVTETAEMESSNTATKPIDQHPSYNPGKKIAVGISVGVVSLGMLSVFAFFIYKLKSKQQTESREVVRTYTLSPPPSPFIYIGNVEASRTATESTSGTANRSPYNKLNVVKQFDRYRPSPELQPLPPLVKPPAEGTGDDDQESNGFQTPRGSVISSDDGCSNTKRIHRSPIPRLKAASPRSRLSVSSSPPIGLMKP